MRLIFWKALMGLLAFDLLLWARGFSSMHRTVRLWKVVKNGHLAADIEAVCQAVNRACVWYPKPVLCLQRSAVTTCLLRGCGVPAQMVIGAQRLPFQAHAWVEVAGHPVNEKRDVRTIYGVWERC